MELNGFRGLTTHVESHGVFAFAEDDRITSPRTRYPHIDYSVDDWGQDLDTYFVLTFRGLFNHLRDFDIPFSHPLFETASSWVLHSVLGSDAHAVQEPGQVTKWLHQLAIGLTVQPDRGIAVRCRLWLDQETDLDELLISELQMALMAPDTPAEVAQAALSSTDAMLSRLQKSLVVVVKLTDSESAMNDLATRFTALAGRAPDANQIPQPAEAVEHARVLPIQNR